ncbi:MAG: TIGR03032 family protein [Magnetococcales bacterium]|nr:TIGR03032 family protein [Magnetococcales bacterium]
MEKESQGQLECVTSRQFISWLEEMQLSLAFTTYQSGKLFLIGVQENGRLSVFERTFTRCMGLVGDEQTLYMSSLYQLWRFENILEAGQTHEGFDRLYVPRLAYTTGDVDAHDLALDHRGNLVFVNTLFSCLASPSLRYSFVPLWKPPFISRLAAEDRCHLNGLAMDQGRPRYVTAVARTDVTDGWRQHRHQGGLVMDTLENEVVAAGFSMPHSPRLHQGRLWLLDSGTGWFGYVDRQAGTFERVAFCPGYLRGMDFAKQYAIVGLSKPRHTTFSGLPLDGALQERQVNAWCGLQVIDTVSGDVVHWLRLEGIVEELYDVAVLPGVRRPMALGLKNDQIRRIINIGPFAN